MSKNWLPVLLGSLLLSSLAGAQTSQAGRTEIEVGSAVLWLGMAEGQALNRLKSAGYRIEALKEHQEYMAVGGENGRAAISSTLSFSSGRLAYADREWLTNSDALGALLGALGSLSGRGARTCVLQHAPLLAPDQNSDRIFVRCGSRSVLIMKGSYQGTDTSSVTESIGAMSTAPGT